MDDAERWETVGRLLGRARRERRLSKRGAALAAGFSEITWRSLEIGKKQLAPGLVVPVNPRDETLEAAARAVGLDPATLFDVAGRTFSGPTFSEPAALSVPQRLDAVEAQLRAQDRKLDEILARLPADEGPR